VAASIASLAVLGTSCTSSSGSSGSTESPSALVAAALHNAVNSGWVHEVSTGHGSSHSLSMVNDVGTSEGRQVIDSDGAQSTVLVLNHVAYINGDATSIATYFQLQTSNPQEFAGQWISIPPSESQYFSAVSASVTLASDFHNVSFLGPFTARPETSLQGVKVIPVVGHVAGLNGEKGVPATLDVTANGRTLPVKLSATDGNTSENVKWSKWGEPVTLPLPGQTIPISKVLASGSSETTT
jgi:hypothetical protein